MSQDNLSDKAAPASIAYTQHGTGPERVLVMHDWNGDHTTYDPVIPYLDGAAFTYIFVDLRGYGKSRHIVGEYSVKEISRDCLEVADKLGWQRFHLIGHSMTGMATQRIAVDAPSRIKSAIAVCPVSAAGSPADEEALRFFRARRKTMTPSAGSSNSLPGGSRINGPMRNCARIGRRWSQGVVRGYLTMFSKTNFVEEVRGLETPYLVVVAENDPGLNEAAMKKTFLAWHPNAELLVIRNCGHYPMQECPPYFATVIENFLRRQIG